MQRFQNPFVCGRFEKVGNFNFINIEISVWWLFKAIFLNIDCPGNLVDPNLEVIYSNADIAVVPIHYDSDTLDATQMFCETFKAHFAAKMFFVPNGIVSVEERREHLQLERDKAIELLKAYGTVTPRVKRSVVISDYNTLLPLTTYQRNAVKYAFEPIINELQEGGVE